ncbi:protein kinase subdomain-containing protein [Nannizzia gypsea CBS 118893]|uniref:Dynein heavy chain, cytoplasmic n=1 Tax=Arthroderma gypseum (strain ATCC MYA-4604 / CBS 118893) TaxID=535722 RepID=E4UYN7_ARTGP|nr:protein kinase subdomain-containing protein [Nannizzia gypsea CBS 118893]EFR03217.1 protein kinase subdomain-containing protein [Nannizzia gypsea CBS 118893]
MEVVSPGATNGVPSPTASMTVDPEVVLHYLAEVIQGTLGALRRDLESSGSLLSQAKYSETLQRCGRFASEAQIALYAHKDTIVPEQANGSDDETEDSHYVYTLSSELSISPTTTAAMAVFKPGQPIDPAVPLYSQIQVLTLPGFASLNNSTTPQGPPISPYEIIYSFVHHGLSPYYEACTRGHDSAQGSKGRNDTDPKTGEVRAKQKFAELELALSHLQQNIEIPALSLPLHEIVQAALDEAQSRGIEPSVELVPAGVLDNHAVINSIQNNVNGWIKSIQAITKMSRDPDNGSAVQEINFWLSMETALEGIETALRDAGVQLTMDVLRHAKRFSTTLSFSADTGLKEAMETVQKYNQLLRDFPLDELESATSLQKVQEALNLIFSHLNKKLRICPYPIKRALSLVAAISGDLDATIQKLIPGRSIMHYDYTEFHSLMRAAQIVWRTWDENIKEFTNVARDAMRRRNEKFIPIKVKPRHAETQDRLKFINTFRTNHEQLQRTIINVLGTKSNQGGASLSTGADNSTTLEEFGDVDAVEQVTQAYNALKDVNVLDVSPEGTQAWIQAESAYNERTSRVENLMIARLRDKLATAQNANEKFRVFSKFNALLVRPKIRSAIGEYQTKLIDNVKQDIAALHERFKQQYGHSEAHAMAQLRDLPPVSGAIIWAQQIERQLDGYMRKVEDVLGEDWDLHADGQKLQAESNMFRKKLDTRPVFQAWVQDVKRRNIAISGRLFVITRNRAAGNSLELAVNFDAQIIALFKEVRNLVWLNFQIPHAITSVSKEAKRVYPFAISLMESVRTLHQTIRAIASMSQSAILLNGYQNDVQALIVKGLPLRWESFIHSYEIHVKQGLANGSTDPSVSSGRGESKHVQFVREFAISTSVLQSKTATLSTMDDNIQKAILALKTCPYDVAVFRNRIDQIQIAIDKLNLENYANLGYWVANLNSKIETILQDRLRSAIRRWIASFQYAGDEQSTAGNTIETSGNGEEQDTSYIQFPKSLHEISMKNQVMHLDPPLEYARASWFAHFDEWVGVLCNLEKIKSSRYKMSIHADNGSYSETHFSDIPQYCSEELGEVYSLIEARLEEISEYVDKWLQFQSLWDLQSSHVYDILGEDLSQWLQLLHEIRKSRGTFDTSEVRRSFGNVRIDYEQVQTKVNAKYDQWQREILLKFAGKLGARMRDVHAELEAARRDLEGQSLEASSTAQAVSFITIVQQCKRKAKLWEPEIDLFLQGQATLIRQRYQAPSDWLPADRVSGEWDALNEILERRSKTVQDQTDALRAKISAEDRVINEKIAEAVNQWNEEKPVSGSTPPEEASATLSYFQSRLEKLQSESEMVSKAKEALDLPSSPETTLAAILEEVQDFMAVWAALSTIWKSLNELRDTLWNSIQPRKLRQSLDGLIKMTKEMPSRMRQYAAFEHIQNVLRGFLKVNPLLADMKSEAVRERHWQKIFKALKPGKRFSQISMTLGDVWDLQLGPSESVIRDIITQAQGEMALEEFLRSVRETWQSYTLDLVNYQNKCRLIRGFDDLFAKCSENLNSLQAMRHSPYFKEFEEEATTWEDKLTRIHVLFDVWIDVQRQWVYLEGVFTGNADIKHLLPLESGRFQNINSEFFAVMKKVYKSPLILDVLAITGVQKSLERLAELLHKIQKALGEYLEKERVSFPRFYFVGDEDLLEIIGNSNDTLRVAKHFKKMFAGLSGLLIDDDGNIIGVSSKEGEEVMLKREVSLVKTPRINDWLTALDNNVKLTLAELLTEAIEQFEPIYSASEVDSTAFQDYIANYPAQIVVLGSQVVWTNAVQKALEAGGGGLQALYDAEVRVLDILALTVLGDLDAITRKKCEHLITEFVHQRDAITKLMSFNASSPTHYLWLLQMRYVYQPSGDFLQRLHVCMANAKLSYGFEYLGVPERLVRTPLTDRCFLTLTQALCQRLGGSPYGPAGTGKTESVKALGLQLGRFTLVFCCDDTFDFQAMGRIFLGICQVGAWGCFDEFNRLEERILSAVSQQIQNIQIGLKNSEDETKAQIDLVGRQLRVNMNTGIFITMNPGYAGRSNLPDNLKKLFRSVAMSKPDKELIAEVMLFSQGFKQAKALSRQTVPFFDHCASRLSKQAHYDFGLRALKSVLVSSGGLKRLRLASSDGDIGPDEHIEPQIIVQSIRETIAPKLIREDVETLLEIQAGDFPGVEYVPANFEKLTQAIKDIAAENHYVASDIWIAKILQLYQIQGIHHGVMMVGSSGSGKSAAWKVLLQALQRVEGIEGVSHIIDSKVMSKEALYGNLDNTTREWTDGLFTGILRKVVDNLRGEDSKRHWIVFDGDVDPEWVENLNSVLDDNKLLTLPNGERLNLPPNVRVMFEVENLKYATLATVSRCGMVWFNDDTVTSTMMITNYVESLKEKIFEDLDDDSVPAGQSSAKTMATQGAIATFLGELLLRDDVILNALQEARKYTHIMEYSDIRALGTLFSLLNKACRNILEYNIQHVDFPLEPEQAESYMSKKLLLALVWSLTGDCPLGERKQFGEYVVAFSSTDTPLLGDSASLIDYDVSLPKAEWTPWQSQVPSIEINTHSVTQTDVIIPTLDTVRHEDVLYSWLAEHKPLLLCGPPGSGKTMTLFSALRKLPNMEVVGLNFSSATTPDLLIKTFEQYCEYKKTLNGVVMSPSQIGRWLVIFCDEINLPARDHYGTQRAISFLRQLVEQNGFWRTSDKTWITLDRIQFVGACNPPTDAGRTPLGERFLRHAPLVMVDYPGEISLLQIYGTFNSAVLKIIPMLRGYSEALTKAMVQFYLESQARFTTKIQPHYVYSPRELTRWVRGVYEAIKPLENLSIEGLVRIWAHEALRLFQDRLVDESEQQWTAESVKRIALEHFPNIDENAALSSPILFSNWLSKNYVPVEQEQLRDFVKARLRTFCEEEVDVPLVLFNDVLEHALRIDRVFRQPQGHLILIGVSGSGKTTLSRFVAWMNGLKVFQIKVHGKYSGEDFDEDLRSVLRRAGCKGEKICFIMDEANVLDSGFLERMNTLLANAEVPGLFEGDEFASLMTACKEGAQRQGLLLDSQEELYKWFTQQIVNNLHVVFTMNPPEDGLSSKAATSPALFNRCVLNWMGDWSDQALYQVGYELTQSVDLDKPNFVAPDSIPVAYRGLSLPASHRDTVVNAMVYVHYSLHRFNQRLQKQQDKSTYLTPRHYLDFVAHYVKLFNEKREDLEEQQRHLNVGLEKLRDTVDKVRDLRASLAQKKNQLEKKDAEANEKLQRMVADQREAEQRKSASLEIQTALEKQEKEVASRKEIVLNDLANAEPAVLEAQKSVSNIKKQHLTEVRSMSNPPSGVRLALESVCALLGHKVESWKTIQGIVRKDDFIASIVNYDNERQMTRQLRAKMLNEFLSKEEFTFERVNHASKACGPLVQWVQAQVNYSSILDRVGPLREEVGQLEEQALQTKAEAQAIENTINDLENSIATYKVEYAALISETQAIKSEMSRVEFKVDRSVRLLDSLSSERSRWEEGSKTFETQISTLVGDVLIAAAFLAYGGLYDQQFRKAMIDDWMHHLSQSNIDLKPHNPVTEYLSNADERLSWQSNSLPVDDLCTENAIILNRFNRYPLIIDPSGRVTEFLEKENRDRKLTVTSFLDDSFVKQLESALRFGNPILIQDAEHLDPILNHVLNKEYQKTGGRVLIQLGKQEIDFSPSFKLFLSTRDPSASFPPDICSRTTFVNFTVTQSSLQTQSLNEVLKSERPDVDERRTNLIKVQGEFKIHLRQLEKKLLQALNESRGNILDDDNVIETLETLKKEAWEISNKMVETEGVMAEVDNITLQYNIIARSCSAVFAVLEQLHHLNHFYQFSLQYFVDIFNDVLHNNKRLAQERDYTARVNIILRDLFIAAFQRTSLGLLQKDRVTLAVLLAQASPYPMDKGLIDMILDTTVEGCDVSADSNLRAPAMSALAQMSVFKSTLPNISAEQWEVFLSEEFAENFVPNVWEEGTSEFDQQLRSLLLVKLLRLDRFVPAAERFVVTVFGKDLLDDGDDLKEVVEQVTSTTPIALSSSPGFDASYKVDGLVERTHRSCANIAMGSNEGLESADKAISNAAATGNWVLVKNVHLAPSWLQSLEKRLESLKPHKDFRLFLSMESSPKIPVNLIRASRVLMYEQPAGVRANVKDSLSSLSLRATSPPVEKARLYLLLSFLHAVIQERLRYAPSLGWKGFWEFNDSDYECSAFIIDTWVASIAQGRSNVAPQKIPWDLIRTLITETYGGKIDDAGDFALLAKLVDTFLTPAAFEDDHKLVPDVENDEALILPTSTGIQDFLAWVNRLPEREPPTYLGLPANAEKLLLVGHGKRMISNLSKVTTLLDEGEQLMVETATI